MIEGTRISDSHFCACGILPCNRLTLTGWPAGSLQLICCRPSAAPHTRTRPSAAAGLGKRFSSAADSATARLTPSEETTAID